jgi:hypothetical protein
MLLQVASWLRLVFQVWRLMFDTSDHQTEVFSIPQQSFDQLVTVKDERQAPMDEKFRTSAVVKKKPEVKKKPKVQLPPWIKDTEKTTSVTAEKKVWKPIDKKFQTSVTTVPLPKEQEKPEDVCPPWVVTDTQIDKRMTITAMGKSITKVRTTHSFLTSLVAVQGQ